MPVPADQKVAEHGRILKQFDVLECAGDTELGDAEGGLFGNVLILEINLAGCRAVDPRDQVEDRAFAGTIGADDRENLALLHREADGVDRLQAAEMQRQILAAALTHRLRSAFTYIFCRLKVA